MQEAGACAQSGAQPEVGEGAVALTFCATTMAASKMGCQLAMSKCRPVMDHGCEQDGLR